MRCIFHIVTLLALTLSLKIYLCGGPIVVQFVVSSTTLCRIVWWSHFFSIISLIIIIYFIKQNLKLRGYYKEAYALL